MTQGMSPLSAGEAVEMKRLVEIHACHAEADAELHAHPLHENDSIDGALARINAVQAEGTAKPEQLLQHAFQRLDLLIEARALREPLAQERDVLLAEHMEAVRSAQREIAAAVRADALPASSLESFNSAFTIAASPRVRESVRRVVAERQRIER